MPNSLNLTSYFITKVTLTYINTIYKTESSQSHDIYKNDKITFWPNFLSLLTNKISIKEGGKGVCYQNIHCQFMTSTWLHDYVYCGQLENMIVEYYQKHYQI